MVAELAQKVAGLGLNERTRIRSILRPPIGI
jgi:hypothetical protein